MPWQLRAKRADVADKTQDMEGVHRYNEQAAFPVAARTHAEVCRFFAGLDLIEPGVVQVHRWRAGVGELATVATWPFMPESGGNRNSGPGVTPFGQDPRAASAGPRRPGWAARAEPGQAAPGRCRGFGQPNWHLAHCWPHRLGR